MYTYILYIFIASYVYHSHQRILLMKNSVPEIVKTELGLIISNKYNLFTEDSGWDLLRAVCRHANSLDFNFTLETEAAIKTLQTSYEVSSHQINTEIVIEISVSYIISEIDPALVSSVYWSCIIVYDVL